MQVFRNIIWYITREFNCSLFQRCGLPSDTGCKPTVISRPGSVDERLADCCRVVWLQLWLLCKCVAVPIGAPALCRSCFEVEDKNNTMREILIYYKVCQNVLCFFVCSFHIFIHLFHLCSEYGTFYRLDLNAYFHAFGCLYLLTLLHQSSDVWHHLMPRVSMSFLDWHGIIQP